MAHFLYLLLISHSLGKIFTNLNKAEASYSILKYTLTQVFCYEFCKAFKSSLFTEYLRTTASETFNEGSLGNSARGEKCFATDENAHIILIFPARLTKFKFSARAENLHIIISPLDFWLCSWYAFAQRLSILKNRMKNVEKTTMIKSISHWWMTGL